MCFQSRAVLNFSTAWPSWSGVPHRWQGTPTEAGSKTRGGWEHQKVRGHTTLKEHMAMLLQGCLKPGWPDFILVVIQLCSCVWLSATPWTAPHQASLSFTISRSLLKLVSIESVVPSDHLVLCCPLLLLPLIFPSIRVFYKIGWLFASCGQSIGASASASVLLMNIQGWFPLGLTGLISLQPKRLSRIFNITAQKHPLFFHKGI